jgi:hypothetical protein
MQVFLEAELSRQPYDETVPYADAIIQMIAALIRANRKPAYYSVLLISVVRELIDFFGPLLFSFAFGSPLLTCYEDDWTHSRRRLDDRAEAFRLCKFAMEDTIGYAPCVDSMNDVLRLRRHPAIHRFRECLKEWETALRNPQEDALRKIKRDIIKANQELRTVEKCRKVERWIFWSHLPASLIPLLSHIVVYLDMGLQLCVDSKEQKSSWVLLGR